jgi:shikimate kinase
VVESDRVDNNLVFLVGPMGAGKTTIGKILASELKLAFFDSDAEIEKKAGASISWIFDVEGESGFRVRESRVLEEISHLNNAVIATGGGIVLDNINRKILKDCGVCVYLFSGVDQLVARIGKDKKRPLLQTEETPSAVLARMLEVRDPLYLEVADVVIQTNIRHPRKLAKDIAKKITPLLNFRLDS